MDIEDEELKSFLSKKTCRGCYNHCILTNTNCGRGKIFIKDAIEEFKAKNYQNYKIDL